MKKPLLFLSAFILCSYSFAQTNTFPSSGNVGIGTTSPSEKLEILGNLKLSTGSHVKFGLDYSKIFENGVDQLVIQGHNGILLQSWDGSSSTLYTDLFTRYGKVGIGTTSPSAHLEVKRASSSTSEFLRFTDGNYNIGAIQSLSSTDGRGIIFNAKSEGVSTPEPSLVLAAYSNDLQPNNDYDAAVSVRGYDISDNSPLENLPIFKVLNGHSEVKLSVEANGNIGVGTNSPQEKLSVDGTVLAKKVRVSIAGTDWPDYVFSPNFELRTLEEVESFIEKNQHLPEVPSAKEIETNGLDLGSMDATLLKKVEELTLYMIEQNKRLKQLEIKNQKLEKELETIKKNK
ncbi:hypothetical protein [Roseivirga sp.]|uniref:hypothetical protein n=1 Tax=Roseivirga sp. TaxID=1964215 RepID=UPI003B5251A2